MTSNSDKFKRINRLSKILDSAIPVPGTKFTIGLDGILGLIPGFGDMVTTILSAYIVMVAHGAGASRWTVIRMCGNIGLDLLIGAIPIVGDVSDFFWKANRRNMRLLKETPQLTERTGRDRLFTIGMLFVLIFLVLATLYVGTAFILWLWSSLGAWVQLNG